MRQPRSLAAKLPLFGLNNDFCLCSNFAMFRAKGVQGWMSTGLARPPVSHCGRLNASGSEHQDRACVPAHVHESFDVGLTHASSSQCDKKASTRHDASQGGTVYIDRNKQNVVRFGRCDGGWFRQEASNYHLLLWRGSVSSGCASALPATFILTQFLIHLSCLLIM